MLTIEQVCEVAGLESQTLRNWIANEVIIPSDKGGMGRGHGHRFSVTQSVGLVIAAEIRRSKQGTSLTLIKDLVRSFSDLSEEQLQAEFGQGNTHLVLPDPILLFKPHPKRTDEPNVREAYARVLAKLGK